MADTSDQNVTSSGSRFAARTQVQIAWLITLLAVFVVGFATVMALRASAIAQASNQQWEYKIVAPKYYELDDKLNELGKQGWKLVHARRAMSGSEYLRTYSYEMIFERPLKDRQ